MKKTIKAFITLLVLLTSFIFYSITANAQSIPTHSIANQINIKFVCSEPTFDFSNIKIDIYSAELTHSDEINSYYEYSELYEKTISVDKNGNVSFTRPTPCCSISVQLNSLPNFYGVTRYSKFFTEEDNKIQIQIEKIDSVNIEKILTIMFLS